MTTQNWFADAPPLPFVPFKGVTKEELSVLFTGFSPLANRKRASPRLQLAQAMMCFFATTAALAATSPQGEDTLALWASAARKNVDHRSMAMSGSSHHASGTRGVERP